MKYAGAQYCEAKVQVIEKQAAQSDQLKKIIEQ
jgi:hypothetical protein